MTSARCIAVAQTTPVAGNVAANVDEHVRLARIAGGEGAQLIVFPEMSLTGYEVPLAPGLAFTEDDPRLTALIDVAAATSAILVVGAPVKLGERLHIGAFIVKPDRTIALYTKQRLGAFTGSARVDGTVPPAEATVFDAGDRDPLVTVGDMTAAVAICADIGRPAHAQRAADRGAHLYIASMFVIPSEFDGDATKLAAYAATHSMMVALANFGAPTGGLAAAGRSGIWLSTGDRLMQLPRSGSGVGVAVQTGGGWRAQVIMIGASAARSL